ncbi:hypothetical protein G7Y79_00029g063080 [Physcia stellaris]|nr:hypothetical protein G7Y79_00029g063080 [Physcia stellaris]
MYSYTAPPSEYKYYEYRYETKDSAKHPPPKYGYSSIYTYSDRPTRYSKLDAKPARHSRFSSANRLSYYSTSSQNAYGYDDPHNIRASINTRRSVTLVKSHGPMASRRQGDTKGPSESTKYINMDIRAGYSLRNWDPTEKPLLLLGSCFDANLLGKWIYDWTPSTLKELAGDLSYQCVRQMLNGKIPARLAGLGKLLPMLCLGSFFQVASALPMDPEEPPNNPGWPGGPGLPSISGWPSPFLGLIFAAGVTHFSKPHSTSRMPGAMALVFNYLSLVASGDAQTPPAVLWTLKSLALYFIVFYGDVTFRKFQMGQGYFALLIFLGLIMNYCVTQVLQTGQAEASLLDELFRFSLPTFSLSLCLCAYHAHYKQRAAEALAHTRLEERHQIEERLRRENAVSQDRNAQSRPITQSS